MKKLLIIVSAIFLLLFGGLQLFLFLRRPLPVEELRLKAARLPQLQWRNLEGKPVALDHRKPIVLVYFNSECEHCQREVKAFRENPVFLQKSKLIMMSSQPAADIIAFEKWAGFDQADSVEFLQVSYESVAEAFGTLSMPQIFVYSKDGDLIELFSGETNPAIIAGVIPD